MAQALAEKATGKVTSVNANGFTFQIDPDDEEGHRILSLSKFAEPRPVIPPIGTAVEVGIDAQGYVREIRTATPTATPPSSAGNGASSAGNGASSTAKPASSEGSVGPIDLERSALWATCLHAAAVLKAGDSYDAIEKLADRWYERALAKGRG